MNRYSPTAPRISHPESSLGKPRTGHGRIGAPLGAGTQYDPVRAHCILRLPQGESTSMHATSSSESIQRISPRVRDVGLGRPGLRVRHAAAVLIACAATLLAAPLPAQTVTVVATRHLSGMERPPSAEQFAHTVEALSAFSPTQICVERMTGERIETLVTDPKRHGLTLQPGTHRRPLASVIVPIGVQMQLVLERRPADARDEADALVSRWDALDGDERIRTIGLQLAGFEFHSAVLNWSYLDEAERNAAAKTLGPATVKALGDALGSVHEVYSLGVALARKAGLHRICTVDSLEDETLGMTAALEHGGQAVLDRPEVRARFAVLTERWDTEWHPDAGPQALTEMLRFFNSGEYAELDRRLQWETLREFDSDAGAFRRRTMYWHARTAQISSELYRALARGPEERVLFIVGASHRPFTEADLGAQPWVHVEPALSLLEAK